MADLSKESESTVRRLLRNGQLDTVPDSKPCHLTAESVHAYLRKRLADGPQLPEGVDKSSAPNLRPPSFGHSANADAQIAGLQTVADLQDQVVRLEEENERFRNTILALRQTGSILLDDLGAYTSPKIPNS
ncbi:hypothetical protein [Mycolicibacter arupensis]|uniref:Uncharacterized protein n=1 Tax=Mycolicibacter arupensis TaxID=342002 RepID=A0A5C7XLS8_9MYCO|nr:hypothetical protein [Mycolicibacter arupensis]TXI50298.1 MAG: hypothetical protein E6Q54_21490 [Mycolicibacter arupensis]